MKTYSFHAGEIPTDYSLAFEESLFNTRAHRTLQSPDGWHSFYILHEPKRKVCGAIHIHIADQRAQSPLRAPFGSLEFEHTIPAAIVYEFLQFLEKQLIDRGATSITIKNYPSAYQPGTTSLLQTFLFNLRYNITNAEVDSVLDVKRKDVTSDFNTSHQQQFEKGQREGLKFQVIDIEKLTNVYTFIDSNQRKKGYSLSMSLSQLKQTAETFPAHFKLFGVFKDEVLIAASIGIRVRKNVLYDFYHDHDANVDHLSPVITLIAGMYDYCFDHSIQLLDLGTSAFNGQPNFGLLQFKRSLGSTPTSKMTFHKVLTQ